MSWVESGYISHPTTDNQFSSALSVRDLYNVSTMFDETMTIRVSLKVFSMLELSYTYIFEKLLKIQVLHLTKTNPLSFASQSLHFRMNLPL